jgi:excisionase family DNA binding protein
MKRSPALAVAAQYGLEPLVLRPRDACRLLSVGNTRLYELLSAGELESYLDGRSRKITVESIHRYVLRHLGGVVEQTQSHRGIRRRKDSSATNVP